MEPITTHHQGRLRGRDLRWTVTAETRPSGPGGAGMSLFSYVVQGDDPQRPVVFLFNGGPGSSSVWLHLGGVGPLRVAIPTDLNAPAAPPYLLAPEASSLLGIADLVFIDPVGTGWGDTAQGEELARLSTLNGDAEAFAHVIQDWLHRHGRMGSPRYVLGESYGTMRAPFVATALQRRSIALNGVVLLGQALNVQETSQRPGNVIGYVTSLPLMAAVAQYHGVGRSDLDLGGVIDAAEELANGPLALYLLQGQGAVPDDLARQYCALTGLPMELAVARHLRVSKEEFRKNLLPGRVMGRNDARYAAPRLGVGAVGDELDPSTSFMAPAVVGAAAGYFRDTLGVTHERPYAPVDASAHGRWQWLDAGEKQSFVGSAHASPFNEFSYGNRLAGWLAASAGARLMIGTGVYDTLTTVGAARHLVRQFGLPADRLTLRDYAAGHMMYSDPQVCIALNDDLADFVTQEQP